MGNFDLAFVIRVLKNMKPVLSSLVMFQFYRLAFTLHVASYPDFIFKDLINTIILFKNISKKLHLT